MKLLLVSDLHYALQQYDWTLDMADQVDAVVIAGDQLDIAGALDGSVQVVVILKYLRRLAERTRLIVSSGNHDLDGRDREGERVARWIERVRRMGVPTDGDSVEFDGVLVTVCPWWDGPRAKAAVAAQLARDAARSRRSWIWVYHAPPAGSPTSWVGQRHYGDADLVTWVAEYRPDAVLTGHIHQAPFRSGGSWFDRIGPTWIFNSGQQIGPTPAHVLIDTDAKEAAWFSLAGAEWVDLEGPLRRPAPELTAPRPWL